MHSRCMAQVAEVILACGTALPQVISSLQDCPASGLPDAAAMACVLVLCCMGTVQIVGLFGLKPLKPPAAAGMVMY